MASAFLSQNFYGAVTGDSVQVHGWVLNSGTTATNRFKIGQDAQFDFGSSRSIAVASGGTAYAVRRSDMTIDTNAPCVFWTHIDRQSGGLFKNAYDFYVNDANTYTQGVRVTLERVASANNRCSVRIDTQGATDDPAPVTDGLHDPFNWFVLIKFDWTDSTTLRCRVYFLQGDGSLTQVHTRTFTSFTATSGVVGMFSPGTSGRAYISRLCIATGTAPWAIITRPFTDSTPFARASADGGTHQLVVSGICGNMGSSDTMQGKFVPDGTAEGDVPWETIGTPGAGAETWSGVIPTTAAANTVGTVMVRPAASPTFIDSLKNCTICWVVWIAGQSNAQGRATNPQVYNPSNIGTIPHLWCWPSVLVSETAEPNVRRYWRTLTTENSGGGGEPVMFGATNGTPWIKMAELIAQNMGDMTAIVGEGLGTTALVGGVWASGGSEWLRLVVNLRACGVTKFNAGMWLQGENEVQNQATEAQYLSAFTVMMDDLEAAIPADLGAFMVYTLGFEFYGNITTDTQARNFMAPILAAQLRLRDLRSNTYQGGFIRHIDLSTAAGGDNVHFRSDAEVLGIATAYYQAFRDIFFPGDNAGGPMVMRGSAIWKTPYSEFTVTFDENVQLTGAAASFTGTRVEVNGSAAAHSVSFLDNVATITLNTPATAGDTVRVMYPDGVEVSDGAGVTGKYITAAGDTARPAYAFLETVTVQQDGAPRYRPASAVMQASILPRLKPPAGARRRR